MLFFHGQMQYLDMKILESEPEKKSNKKNL